METHGSFFNLIYHIPGLAGLGITPETFPPFVLAALLVVAGLAFLAWYAHRKYSLHSPGKLQLFLEVLVEWVENFCEQSIGEGGKRYAPFIGTVFLSLLVMNLLGTIPGLLTPTANLNITLGTALIVFLATPWYGIKAVGAKRYFLHLLGKPLALSWFLFPLNLIEECVRPISLSIRLFGNMFADHTMAGIMAALTFTVPFFLWWAPFAFLQTLTIFGVFVAFVQAFVFTALSAVYIAGAVAVHHE